MKMNFEKELIAIAICKTFSRIQSMKLLYSQLGFTLQEASSYVKEEVKNVKLVDGLILRKIENGFILDSGDRTVVVTNDWLQTCSPEWRGMLKEAMNEWS